MGDPSLLLTDPTRTDPALAPAGRHSYYLLAPVPNLEAGIDWPARGRRTPSGRHQGLFGVRCPNRRICVLGIHGIEAGFGLG